MLSPTDLQFFHQNGYIIVPNVYDAAALQYVRELFLTAFDRQMWRQTPNSSPTIINDIYKFFPETVNIVFNPKYIAAIKAILGEKALWLPECSVHHERYVNWHRDTTEQELEGIYPHESTLLLQCATYFQDNTPSGGGLSIVPKSHKLPDRFVRDYRKDLRSRISSKWRKWTHTSVFHHIEDKEEVVNIPTKMGDLLIFNMKTDHRSTYPKSYAPPKPHTFPHQRKLAIFNTFGKRNQGTFDYQNFMKQRSEPYYRFLKSTPPTDNLYTKAKELEIEILW